VAATAAVLLAVVCFGVDLGVEPGARAVIVVPFEQQLPGLLVERGLGIGDD